ncbi:hypothetical protein J9317_03525 [Metabacillus sp. KIGAM252]|uniref:Spore coat protein n=1 Tax=Metabacillus flavus TaxID=2823519 RepID=A0ABS5LB31_9BACI|nr:CotY/CotZ family spore coat protein [Metabacillus flavus]MBS2967844.1 hypothetical protein [Metabacillus flavus]
MRNKHDMFLEFQQRHMTPKKLQELEGSQGLPILLYTESGEPFEGIVINGDDDFFSSPFFILKSIDEIQHCATLTSLKPLSIDGCKVELPDCVYSLKTTSHCITVDLNDFCGIQVLSSKLVNRQLPFINPK